MTHTSEPDIWGYRPSVCFGQFSVWHPYGCGKAGIARFLNIVLCSVLRPRQHGTGYMGDGFYRSKDPTNSIKVLKENLQRKKHKQRRKHNTHRNTK